MRVDVHRNLTRGGYSIRHRGRVIRHADEALLRNVEFVVRKGDRERGIRENKRYVHAFARGELVDGEILPGSGDGIRVNYHPKQHSFFTTADGQPVYRASQVRLDLTGVYAYGIEQ
jgi:hypothetical protein